MSQPVLVKVYGNLAPASPDFRVALDAPLVQALPVRDDILSLEGDMLLVSFEGIYFPEDDFLKTLAEYLKTDQQGKLDVLDLENWVLRRYIFGNGAIENRSAPLNNVLDYSGH